MRQNRESRAQLAKSALSFLAAAVSSSCGLNPCVAFLSFSHRWNSLPLITQIHIALPVCLIRSDTCCRMARNAESHAHDQERVSCRDENQPRGLSPHSTQTLTTSTMRGSRLKKNKRHEKGTPAKKEPQPANQRTRKQEERCNVCSD